MHWHLSGTPNLKVQSISDWKVCTFPSNSCGPVTSSIFILLFVLQLTVTKKSNHYLKRHREQRHYYQRVSKKYAPIDPRGSIRIALDTDSAMVAREKRNRLAVADEALWRTSYAGINGLDVDLFASRQLHQVAKARVEIWNKLYHDG